MKYRFPEVLIGALLTVAIFSAGMVTSASYLPAPSTGLSDNWLTRDAAGFFAFCAVIVASVQAAFFWYQLRLMRESLQDARTAAEAGKSSADAAALSARAAIALQLPLIEIYPDNLSHGDAVAGGEQYETCSVPSITISNLGATRAFLKEVLYGWTVGGDLPAEPKYQFSETFAPNYIVEPDPKTTPRKRFQNDLLLKPGQWSQICSGNYLWFYCDLLYDDFMGEPRSRRVCWRWASKGIGMGWIIENSRAYNRRA